MIVRSMFVTPVINLIPYSRFQVTFHCKILNFVAKFGNSLRSSKFISELASRFVN